MYRSYPLVLLAALSILPLQAGPKPWTVDALMNLKTIGDPEITADGSTVAYVVRSVDSEHNRYRSEIRLVPASGGPSHAVAGSVGGFAPKWSPDGVRLAFLSRQGGSVQIYVTDGKNEPRRATNSETGIEFFRWSPDGRQIGYIAQEPASPEVRKRMDAGDDAIIAGEGYRNSRIAILLVESGVVRTLAIPRHVLSFDWAPDGSRLVYAAQKNSRGRERFHSDLFEYDLQSSRETPLVVQPGQDLSPSYSRDGKQVAFYSQTGVLSFFGERRVGMVPSGGGAIRYIDSEGDVFNGARKFWWSPDHARLLFGAGEGTSDYLFSADVVSGTSKRLNYKLSGTSSFSASADGEHIAWIRASSDKGPDLFVGDRVLTKINPEIAAYSPVHAQTIRWKSSDGLQVEGVLRLPPGYTPGSRIPLLLILHGGPTGVAVESFPIPRMYPTQLFLEAGFAVLEPNFRGSINYGAAFRTPTIQQQGYGDMADVMTGVDKLIADGIADPKRLGVMGWSYGGFLTTWIVSHSDRFQAASIGACSMDWVSHYGESVGVEDGPPEVVQEYFGGQPWIQFENYQRHSPRFFLKNLKTPSLLMRGQRDSDSIGELYLALTELGVPATFVTYPREPHSISEPMHQRDLLRRNLEWFQTHFAAAR